MIKKVTTSQKKKFIKPEIKSKELSLHALLGENGWFGDTSSKTYTADVYYY